MERIRACLIGCGRIAANHLRAAHENRGAVELTAVSDLVPERMTGALAASPFSAGERARVLRYADYREMLRAEKPDLVAVATESGSHAAIALDAIRSGCHVIVEKPIALSMEDADRMIAAAKEKGVLLCANHQNRFNGAVRLLRGAIEEGRFGRLLYGAASVRWNRGPDYYRQAPWRGTWAQDGGALMNQCIHAIDLLLWMMGDEAEEVSAFADRLNHPYIEAEDMGLAIIRFKNGRYGAFEGTTCVCPRSLEQTLSIFGERGTVRLGGMAAGAVEVWRFADGKDDEAEMVARYGKPSTDVYGSGHMPLYADMVSAIREGRPPAVDGEAGRRAVELTLAMYKSAREGQPVRLPLGPFSTLEMRGMFDLHGAGEDPDAGGGRG